MHGAGDGQADPGEMVGSGPDESDYVSTATILIESASFYTTALARPRRNILQQLVAHIEVSYQWRVAFERGRD